MPINTGLTGARRALPDARPLGRVPPGALADALVAFAARPFRQGECVDDVATALYSALGMGSGAARRLATKMARRRRS
jgi:hypothetical protein